MASEPEVHHYAACEDCDLWVWFDEEDLSEIAAEGHSEEKGHNAYHDSVEGEIPESRGRHTA